MSKKTWTKQNKKSETKLDNLLRTLNPHEKSD
jgi:hypothetical protein